MKGFKYRVTEDFTLGLEHRMQGTEDVLQNCTFETWMIVLTDVTSINLKKKKRKGGKSLGEGGGSVMK